MAKENESGEVTTLGGFDFISNMLVRPDGDETSKKKEDDELDGLPYISPKDLLKFASDGNEKTKDEKKVEEDEDENEESEENETEESEEIEEEVIVPEKDNKKSKEETSDLSEEDIEFEKEISKFLKDKFEEEVGWEFSEEDNIESIEDLVEYMSKAVAEASVPQYANDEIKAYDEYIKNGGTSLKDFYEQTYGNALDLKRVNMESANDQKAVIREHLKSQGYKDTIIDRKINSYEEAGILEDEALEAFELLEEYTENKKEKLLETQREKATQLEKQKQAFVTDVEKTINGLTDVRGLKLSTKEKNELLDYILKPGKDGLTQYQKEYQDNIYKNIIESAYFTKNADSFVQRVQSKAASDAYKNVQKSFKNRNSKKMKGSGGQNDGGDAPSLSSFASLLRKI